MKFVLLVEGATERAAAAEILKRWLDPRLNTPVRIQVVAFRGHGEFARKLKTKARMHLDGPNSSEIIAVVGLLDLYGPSFFPPTLRTVEEKQSWGINHFQQMVGHDRFRMYFAVHEFEAWLLCEPAIFPREVRAEVQRLSAQPEQVNFNDPPARRLGSIYFRCMKRKYKKTTNGNQLFSGLDAEVAVSKCPYLRAMLEEMLELARQKGH